MPYLTINCVPRAQIGGASECCGSSLLGARKCQNPQVYRGDSRKEGEILSMLNSNISGKCSFNLCVDLSLKIVSDITKKIGKIKILIFYNFFKIEDRKSKHLRATSL